MDIAFISSGSAAAEAARAELMAKYRSVDPHEAEVIVALGGDGFMLDTLHAYRDCKVPIYGMNRGTVGFLMNDFDVDLLEDRLRSAEERVIHPLKVAATSVQGETREMRAINEISALRQGPQAAHLRIIVDGAERLDRLVGDGVLLATPAGSTAYNYSAFGPILPLGANVLALTPVAAFRPRRWRGAVLPDTAVLRIENCDPDKRPVMLSADSTGFGDMAHAEVVLDRSTSHRLLFDPGHGLEERILNEQFA